MTKQREIWVDNVKILACILVVLGHFFQGIVKSGILPDSNLFGWFDQTIYYFHVPLFFICSGYLYQKVCKVNKPAAWIKNIVNKAIGLGIPYFVFTFFTWSLKQVFSSTINNEADSLFRTLFLTPTAPFWYLYALFFVFCITPTFSNRRIAAVAFIFSLLLKALNLFGFGTGIYAIDSILINEVWFVIGMWLCVYKFPATGANKKRTIYGAAGFLLFIVLSVVIYIEGIDLKIIEFLLGILACISVLCIAAGSFNKNRDFTECFSKYLLPVFLMHTMFAAAVRSLLLRIGMNNPIIHIFTGVAISFLGPVIAAVLLHVTKYPEFILYPGRFIKRNKNNTELK